MGGAFPAGGRRWSWCDVEVPGGHVRSGDGRLYGCSVSVFHASGKAAVPLEELGVGRPCGEPLVGPVEKTVSCFGVVLCVKEFCVHVVG